MSLFWKAAAAVLLAVVLGLSLGKQKDIGVLLTMAVCCMVAMIAISYLEPVLDFLRELETLGDLQGDMLGILLKAVGIGLVSEIAIALLGLYMGLFGAVMMIAPGVGVAFVHYYNGKLGYKHQWTKWAFYAVYPVILIICAICATLA